VLFSYLTEKNNTSETTVAFGDGTDKYKIVNEETKKKFEKDNKTVRGHLLTICQTPYSIYLSPSNL